MIYPWDDQDEASKGVVAFLEIDNRRCTASPGGECFPTANEVLIFTYIIFHTCICNNHI